MRGLVALAWALTGAGCVAPPEPVRLTNPNPAIKARAAKRAVESPDAKSVHQLVKDLDNDDSAVRFYAIGALRRMTGDSLGYDYFADEEQRKPALRRWQEWLEARESAPATQPVHDSTAATSAKPGG